MAKHDNVYITFLLALHPAWFVMWNDFQNTILYLTTTIIKWRPNLSFLPLQMTG